MKKNHFTIFVIILFLFNIGANLAHPVTPTFIVERQLDSSMFGVALAAMMIMNFTFSPFWGKLCSYLPTKKIMLFCCGGYAIGQVFFSLANTEIYVVLGRMFAGIFVGGCFTAFSNYVINTSANNSQLKNSRLTIMLTIQSVASACGFFIGGMLGLVSTETSLWSQVVVLAVSGLLFYLFLLDDTEMKVIPDTRLNVKEVNPFSAFVQSKYFMTPILANIFMMVAIAAIGQNSYEQCFNYFIKDQYGMSSAYNGAFKAAIALITLTLNFTLTSYLQKKTDVNKTFMYVVLACMCLTGSILIYRPQYYFIAVYILYSGVNAVRLPLMQSLVASKGNSQNSNAMMGFYQAMNSLGGIFGALFAGLIYAASPLLPFILAFVAYGLTFVLAIVYQGRYKREG